MDEGYMNHTSVLGGFLESYTYQVFFEASGLPCPSPYIRNIMKNSGRGAKWI